MNFILGKSVAVAMFLSVLSGTEKFFLLCYLAVIIHELSHLAVCRMLNIKTYGISLSIFGMKLEISPDASPQKRIIVSAAGPVMSFLMFLICILLRKTFNVFAPVFEFANICIAVVNLIPSMPLDGGCMIKYALANRFGIIRGGKIMSRISVSVTAMLVIGIIGIMKEGYINLSAFIFLVFLIISLKTEHKNQIYEKNLVLSGQIKSRQKPRYIAVESNYEILKLAEMISPSYFLIAAIFENGKFKGELNQHQIIENIGHRYYSEDNFNT